MTRSTARPRLTLEPLEDRLLLSAAASIAAAPPRSAVIRGFAFNDINRDGQRGPGEAGLAGRTVFLDLNRDGRLEAGEPRTTTAGNGAFAFIATHLFFGFNTLPRLELGYSCGPCNCLNRDR